MPFARGAVDELCSHLIRSLRSFGVDAEARHIPSGRNPAARLVEEMLLHRSLQVSNVDRIIGLTFPACLIPHDNKVLWLLDDGVGHAMSSAVCAAEKLACEEARRVFSSSKLTADRLRRYSGVTSAVLPAPLHDAELFRGGEPGNYIFAGAAMRGEQRQSLLIRALRYAPAARIVIAGGPEMAQDRARLELLAEHKGVRSQLQLDLRPLAREELAQYVNHASAILHIPVDEDPLDLTVWEAFSASKAVVTTSDADGVLQWVTHGSTGLVVEPNASSLGGALQTLAGAAHLCHNMGACARRAFEGCEVTWSSTIQRLLA